MSALTASQIAEGWIAHDGKGFPEAALQYELIGYMSATSRDGVTKVKAEREASLRLADLSMWVGQDQNWHVLAWRPIGVQQAPAPAPTPAEVAIDPNDPMIRRDERPAYDVDAMAGNGCIFGTPRVERCNLLVVADIPRNGFSAWGAS